MAVSADRRARSSFVAARGPWPVPRPLRALLVALAAILPVVLITGAGAAAAYPVLQTGGASFVELAMQQWTSQASELYGLNVNYEVSSSVLGLNDFALNQVDFAESDIPYSSNQAQYSPTIPYQYMPDVAGAVAFMYNLIGNDGNRITNLVLDAQTLCEIFTGAIVYWDDPSIEALNPGLVGDLPHKTIIPVYRADASGENYLFSDYLLHMDNGPFTKYQAAVGADVGQPTAIWPTPQNGESPPGYPNWATNTPIGQNGSDAAATFVSESSNVDSITFVETAFAIYYHMPVASIVNASGNAVQPTSTNDAIALEKAILYPDLTQNLSYVYTNPLPDAYPLSSYSYFVTPCSPQLAAQEQPSTSCAANGSGSSSFPSSKGNALGQFVQFVACAGQEKMAQLGYSPLPPNLVEEDFAAIGRLNGAQEPPPPTAENCKNPYVDGSTPLPGEPPILNTQQAQQLQNGGTVPGLTSTTGAASSSVGGGSVAGGGSSGTGQSGGSTASGPYSFAVNGSSGPTPAEIAKLKSDQGPNKFLRAQRLDAALRGVGDLSPLAIVGWTALALAVVGVPQLVWWERRRRKERSALAGGEG